MSRAFRMVAVPALVVAAVVSGWLTGSVAGAAEDGPVVVGTDVTAYPDVVVTVDLPPALWGATGASVVEAGRPRPAELQRGAHGALEVVLVVDSSGSMAGAPIAAARSAAAAFIAGLPAETGVALVGFGATPYVLSPLTSDRAALAAAVERLGAAGETALYDALSVAATQFSGAPVARSIILVSDGGDTASSRSLDDVTGALVGAQVRLFGVQLVTSEAQRAVLESLAAATGGRAVEAGDAGGLGATYAAVAGDALRRVHVRYSTDARGRVPVEVRFGAGDAAVAAVELDLPPAPAAVAGPATPRPPSPSPTPAAGRPRALVLGGGALFVALALLGTLVLVQPRRSLLAGSRRPGAPIRERMKAQAGELVERRLEQRGKRRALGAKLETAGVALRPGEYVVLVAATALFALAFGLLVGGPIFGLLFGAVVVLVARMLLSSRTGKRRAELEKQLPDLLQQLTSSLRAGYGVMQAIDAASHELEAPMADELHRLVTEVQLGRDLTEALRSTGERVGGQDFEWVVQAIEINREVGGELGEVLDAVSSTIRARDHLRRQVKTLSAQGRLSARVLLAMPFVMAAILSLLNPGYLSPLGSGGGFLLVLLGGVLMLVGWVWTRRLVRPRF